MNGDRVFRIGTSSECEINVPNGIPANAVWAELVVTGEKMHQLTVVEHSVPCLVNGIVVAKQYWVNEQDTIEIDGHVLNWDYIRGNTIEPFVCKCGHRKLVIMCIVLSIILFASGLVVFFLSHNKKQLVYLSAAELYSEVCSLMSSGNVDEYQLGYNRLERLASDSLYIPAVLKYYDIVLEARDTSKWNQAFGNMLSISDVSYVAAYECALCLSYMSPKLSLPEIKIYDFIIEKDYQKANRLFEIVLKENAGDYKAIFWQLINLITLNNDRPLSEQDTQKMQTLYGLLNSNIPSSGEEDAELYRKETNRIIYTILRNWHVID